MNKLISYTAWMAAAACIFIWSDPAAAVPETGRHVSNRIKIERPKVPIAPPEVKEIKTETPEPTKSIVVVPVAEPESKIVKPDDKKVPDEPKEAVATLVVEDPLASQLPGRFYSRKGRMSPFEPFLFSQEPEVTLSEQEQLQIRAPQTPLEKMDLAQLRLTGILRSTGKIRALVEEASGKGYVINEGTYIGNKGGQVSKIMPDRVVVEEKYLDIYGKIAVRERELKLQN